MVAPTSGGGSDTPAVTMAKVNLASVNSIATAKIGAMETDIKTQLDSYSGGGELTQADLLKLQFNIAKYAITATTFSSVTKEITDSLKQTANKIG